jgi:hypothetical protein
MWGLALPMSVADHALQRYNGLFHGQADNLVIEPGLGKEDY